MYEAGMYMALRIQKRPFNEIYDIRLQTHTSTFYGPFVFSTTDFFPNESSSSFHLNERMWFEIEITHLIVAFLPLYSVFMWGWVWNKKYIFLKWTWFNWQKGIFISIFISQFFHSLENGLCINKWVFFTKFETLYSYKCVLGMKSQKILISAVGW